MNLILNNENVKIKCCPLRLHYKYLKRKSNESINIILNPIKLVAWLVNIVRPDLLMHFLASCV